MPDDLLDQARAAEQAIANGQKLGPLHGLPVGIKDTTPTAGLRTTYGSHAYADNVPTADAIVVQRLKTAGAIVMGKTNTPEFAAGANTYNAIFGHTRNPWDPSLSAGGSTGGGAVGLATGMFSLAQGTDFGGSLRIPASFCGVVGLRPSPGLVPTFPVGFAWDTLHLTGPMARTAEDVALMLQAIAGPSRHTPYSLPIDGRDFVGTVRAGVRDDVRIGYVADIAHIGIDHDVARVCRTAVDALAHEGTIVDEIELDLGYAWQAFIDLRGYALVAEMYGRLDHIDEFGPNLAGNIRSGMGITVEALAAAEAGRARLWHQMTALFETYDYLLTPCMAIPPFPFDQNYPESINGQPMNSYIDWVAPTFLLSLTGLPVGCVPCGSNADGLPVGMQIVGPQFGEEAVLALAARMQSLRTVGLPVA